MPRIICLFIFLLSANLCFAAADTTVTVVRKTKPKLVVVTDTTAVTERHFNAKALDAYKKLPEFDYKDSYQGPSLWARFWKWFWSLFDFTFLKGEKSLTFMQWVMIVLKYILIGAGLFAIVFLILKLAGIDTLGLFRRKPYAQPLQYSESAENIHEIDFEDGIEKAIAVGNYRLAVRLLYLKTLKQLSDNGLIDWQLSKTNTNYINELTNPHQREEFKQLTYQFEYVWYGDFMINSDLYKKISALFQNFKGNAA